MTYRDFDPSFYFTVPLRDATAIRRELNDRCIPYEIRSLPGGRIAFVFPDLPPRTVGAGAENIRRERNPY